MLLVPQQLVLRTDGHFFNLASLKAKQNLKIVITRDLLFANDAALMAHSAQELQTLLKKFSLAYNK